MNAGQKSRDAIYVEYSLKTLDTISNCQRLVKDQSSHLVYLIICEKLSSISRRSCKITMKEKTPFVTRSCVVLDG